MRTPQFPSNIKAFVLMTRLNEVKVTLNKILGGSGHEPNDCISVQILPISYLPSLEYALLILAQQLESMKRGLKLAEKPGLDLLLRILREHQISRALEKVSKALDEQYVILGLGSTTCVNRLKGLLRIDRDVKPGLPRSDETTGDTHRTAANAIVGCTNYLDAVSLFLAEEAALLNARAKKPP